MINSTEQIITQNLIDLRKSKNLKQSELSEAIGYSDKTISRWENGTTIPDISTLVKLANYYGVGLEDLIHENAVEKRNENKKSNNQQILINNYFMTALLVLTIWVVSVLIHVGLIMIQKIDFWEIYILAIPASCLVIYRRTRKQFALKWLNFSLLSLTISTCILFFYLIYLYYNFWQLFILVVPIEGIIAISTLVPKKPKLHRQKKQKIKHKK